MKGAVLILSFVMLSSNICCVMCCCQSPLLFVLHYHSLFLFYSVLFFIGCPIVSQACLKRIVYFVLHFFAAKHTFTFSQSRDVLSVLVCGDVM